jgi:predicted HTH transcriptional regulator
MLKKMNDIDKVLQKIDSSIQNQVFEDIETERLELKDLSTKGDWDELYKTVCAFLNTNGGRIIIGIRENTGKNKGYKFTGFNYNNENKLKEIHKQFTDKNDKALEISHYFPTAEMKDFREGKIVVMYVIQLPEDEKFAYFKGKAYKRKLTGDHEISPKEIEAHEELKEELLQSQELEVIKSVALEILNIDTLNQYILKLNQHKKIETLKADLENALSFLVRKRFVIENKPTLLGMLVCADYVEDYLMGRCEVDCYVKSEITVAQNKQILRGNIVSLIEESTAFVYKNIQIGVSRENGGRAIPEYPRELIEEHINNALAHRDYKSNRFIIIEITPSKNIMIQNPGSFRQKQRLYIDNEVSKVRRVIPIQYARNPRLTDLLKSFDYWEGKGKGLASLTNACLDNQIDLPYYILGLNEVKLFIPKGKVYDEKMELHLKSFEFYLNQKNGQELNEEERIVLSYFYKCEKHNRLDRYTILLTSDNNHKGTIANLEDKGLLFKHPESPQIYPIYLVDRVLMKNNYLSELKEIFGDDFNDLKTEYRQVLEAIYLYKTYANPSEVVSANSIGHFLYIKENPIVSNLKEYENFKRKIRNIFNKLEKGDFIIRKDDATKKPDFLLNKGFGRQQHLF